MGGKKVDKWNEADFIHKYSKHLVQFGQAQLEELQGVSMPFLFLFQLVEY